MHNLQELIDRVNAGQELDKIQVRSALDCLQDPDIPVEKRAEFLSAWRRKGETADEMAELANSAIDRAVKPWSVRPPYDVIADVCGTGADQLHTFNISTALMFVLAAAGVRVAKHGNRAATSQCGSADVLEELGINISLPPGRVDVCLKDVGCTFLWAVQYHPVFKNIAPVRKLLSEKGERSVFNLLGPLVNPARPNVQMVGMGATTDLAKIASVLQRLGCKRAFVYQGRTESNQIMDEISPCGSNEGVLLRPDGQLANLKFSPEQFGIQPSAVEQLRGGDRKVNAAILTDLLAGKVTGPKRDALLINSAYGLWISERVSTPEQGFSLANELLSNGAAYAKLRQLQEFHKTSL